MDDVVVEAAALCRYDPLAWARFAFDWSYGELDGYAGPRAWQAEAFAEIAAHLKNTETRHMPPDAGAGFGGTVSANRPLSAC